MALCHMTQLTNQNWPTTMAVTNDAQLSKDFDGLYLAKGIVMFVLSPRVIHNIAVSVVLSIYFAQETNEMSNINTLFIFNRRTCIPSSKANFRVTEF